MYSRLPPYKVVLQGVVSVSTLYRSLTVAWLPIRVRRTHNFQYLNLSSAVSSSKNRTFNASSARRPFVAVSCHSTSSPGPVKMVHHGRGTGEVSVVTNFPLSPSKVLHDGRDKNIFKPAHSFGLHVLFGAPRFHTGNGTNCGRSSRYQILEHFYNDLKGLPELPFVKTACTMRR